MPKSSSVKKAKKPPKKPKGNNNIVTLHEYCGWENLLDMCYIITKLEFSILIRDFNFQEFYFSMREILFPVLDENSMTDLNHQGVCAFNTCREDDAHRHGHCMNAPGTTSSASAFRHALDVRAQEMCGS